MTFNSTDSATTPFIDLSSEINPKTWTPYYLSLLLLYPLICHILRKQRLRNTLLTYPYTTRASLASMTDRDASAIQNIIGQLEFPFITEKALQFALFRTYGNPSVSSVLVGTGQLSEPATASKRYADTVMMFAEFMNFEPDSERCREVIARMNFIHSQYQKSGKVLNDDMLYTLALCYQEPVRWINKYEWRHLEEFEVCAIATFWKSLGDAMGIDYSSLRSGSGAGDGKGGGGRWKDGLEWGQEMSEWCEGYEREKMVPAYTNWKTAEETTRILLWTVPGFMKGVGRHFVSALMDDRLRKSMLYPDPPVIYFHLITVIFGIRKFILRHLSLPRPEFLRVRYTTEKPLPDGSFVAAKYEGAPYYIQATLWIRWGPGAWMQRLMGLPLPGDDGDEFCPGGYRIKEMGPDKMRGKGGEYVERVAEELKVTRTGGCVFAQKG